jgi:flagellum-specific ATP synthase
VDRAIAVNEPLENILGQAKDDTSSIEESFAVLSGILGDGG